MRSAYTAGVLDVLHDNGLVFGGYAGSSTGATHLCSYLSEQRKRNYRIDILHSADKHYMGFANWMRTGNFFEVEYRYHTLPQEIDPFDFDTFKKNTAESKFYVTCTNVETGRAEYPIIRDLRKEDDLNYVRASASLPLFSQMVQVQGNNYLDGSMSDSVPFKMMDNFGFRKQVVILTRPENYIKGKNVFLPLLKFFYRKNPQFVKAIAERHLRYNEDMELLKKWESSKKAFVIRPSKSLKISHIEKSKLKLEAFYHLGASDAKAQIPELFNFLEAANFPSNRLRK